MKGLHGLPNDLRLPTTEMFKRLREVSMRQESRDTVVRDGAKKPKGTVGQRRLRTASSRVVSIPYAKGGTGFGE
eukprot:1179452-Prorocentrum_minimum.AAC.4